MSIWSRITDALSALRKGEDRVVLETIRALSNTPTNLEREDHSDD